MNIEKMNDEEKKRLEEASENLKEILKKLEPFIQPKKIGYRAAQGEWKKPSTSTTTVVLTSSIPQRIKNERENTSQVSPCYKIF
jgi:hypothetical protein